MSQTTVDERNNRTEIMTDKITHVKVIAKSSDKAFSNERIEKQHNFLISDNELLDKDKQGKKNLFFNEKPQKILDPFTFKIKKQPPDPTKLLAASEEPSHYSELATKLDHLVEKVLEFAKGSGHILVKNPERTEFEDVTRNLSFESIKATTLPQQKYFDLGNIMDKRASGTLGNNKSQEEFSSPQRVGKCIKKVGKLNYLDKDFDMVSVHNDMGSAAKQDPQYFTYRMANKHSRTEMVPPILNDNIKYIKVSLKDLIKKEYNIEFPHNIEHVPALYQKQASIKEHLRQLDKPPNGFKRPLTSDTICESLNLNNYIKEITSVNEINQETFQILISGHLTRQETPVFIIHKTYVGSSILIKDSFDFRTHKKEGNVDIFLTGKFFHDNILIENDKGYPSALDLKSHMLLIDSKSDVTQGRFKHTFHLGSFEAVLEGEFVKNTETLQYIPIFSLEIVKHKSSVERAFLKSTTTTGSDNEYLMNTSSYETQESKTDEEENIEISHNLQKHKRVHYLANSQGNASKSKGPKNTKVKTKDSKFKKFMEGTFFKIFFRNRQNNRNDSQHGKSAQSTSGTRNTNKKGKGETKYSSGPNDETSQKDHKPQKNVIMEIYEVDTSNESSSSSKSVITGAKSNTSRDKTIVRKSKKKNRNKLSTIIENPGVTQMQGFFFQT